ncbi:hypothetical protein L9F63_004246, partial [Diploptera punctata]
SFTPSGIRQPYSFTDTRSPTRRSPRLSQTVTPDAEIATAALLETISAEKIAIPSKLKREKSFQFMKRKSLERPSRISQIRPSSQMSFQRGFEVDRLKVPRHMNSYRLDPKNPFKPDRVRQVIKTILEKELHDLQYDPVKCGKQCMILSNDIRNKIKLLGFDRHKLICTVDIGEKSNQSVFTGVKFLWDPERDNFSFYSYENTYIFALATVYGIYYE